VLPADKIGGPHMGMALGQSALVSPVLPSWAPPLQWRPHPRTGDGAALTMEATLGRPTPITVGRQPATAAAGT